MRDSNSLAGRAALAVALMIGFYLLAVGIAALLLWLPYAELKFAHRIHGKLLIACVIGAGIILWSVVPRPDRFVAPGPTLARDLHPDLFRLIDDVARATGQPPPAEVYLVPDVNAWVSSRGGVMGFGSRRIMGLGLPLLQTFSVSELRGVLAHEFGHYHGGDVALGPWVYNTRAAIGRTLQGLEEHSSLLQKPFEWYGGLFLRVTHAISRAQEYAADALAASVAGVAAMQTGLRKVAGAAGAFDQYWRTEVDPVLGAGYRPPIADGFRRFLATESIATAMARFVEKEEKEGESNPYDTHPPLRERLAALERVPGPRFAADIRAAIELLADPVGLERQLLDHLLVADYARKLEDVRWEDVGKDVYVPSWQETLAKDGSVFAGIAVGDLADRLSDLDGLTKTLASRPQGSPEDQEAHARWLAGVALASALVRHGWSVRALPGEPITLSGPDGDFTPFGVTAELADRKADPGEWRERCHRLGIADLPLAA